MFDLKELRQVCKDFTVLYAEDEERLRLDVRDYLLKFFKLVDTAKDGKESLSKYEKNPYDIVITDILMPNMDGLDMASEIKKINKNQKIIIVSAYADRDSFLKSIKIGIDGYIVKPFDYKQINEVLYKTAKALRESKENKMFENQLLEMVHNKVEEIRKLEKSKDENYKDALHTLVDLIEQRDSYTGGHSDRVARYCKMIAQELKFNKKDIDTIYEAGILHDIGKVAIPDSVLLKPGKLNDIEYKLIQKHVEIGYDILIKSPMFKDIANIIKEHHERVDGSGYPNALHGDEISLCGKIMAVADSFDAMTTNRIYKIKKEAPEALKEIEALSGIGFDSKVVDAALNALKDVRIEQNINQLPANDMEKERFSYFYKDQLTGIYNENYLDLVLNQQDFMKEFYMLNILCLKDFSSYNKKYGWSAGDTFLKDIAQILHLEHPKSFTFRIQGDDFAALSSSEIDFHRACEKCKKNSIECLHITINLKKQKITSMKSLEKFIQEHIS
jgi:putative nucleotidyltransferase with HDIG domain